MKRLTLLAITIAIIGIAARGQNVSVRENITVKQEQGLQYVPSDPNISNIEAARELNDITKASDASISKKMIEINRDFNREDYMNGVVKDQKINHQDKKVLLDYLVYKFNKYDSINNASKDVYWVFTKESKTIRENVNDVLRYAQIGVVNDSIKTASYKRK